jgi:hypothetical protein
VTSDHQPSLPHPTLPTPLNRVAIFTSLQTPVDHYQAQRSKSGLLIGLLWSSRPELRKCLHQLPHTTPVHSNCTPALDCSRLTLYTVLHGISEVHTTSATDIREVIHLHSCPDLSRLLIYSYLTFFTISNLCLHNPWHSFSLSSFNQSLTHSLTPLLHQQHHIHQSQCPLDSTNFNQRPHMALVLPHHIGHTDHNRRQHQTTHNEHPPPPTPRARRRLHTRPLPTHTTPKPATRWINNNPKSSPFVAQDAQNA